MVVSEGAISNIMGGMENTAGVRLHSHRHKLKQRFDIIRKLGQGTYGKVQLAVNKDTGQEVAIKTIKKAKIETEQDLVRIRREIQIMSSVQHPQIIHIFEVFENREKMVLVMEYAAGGELYDYLSERKVLSVEEARRVFRQVASATYYCHKHKICHRDLKLENILLDIEGNAKIADFGLSNVFDEKRRLDTFCGSPLYASPEIVKGVPYVGPEVDCWSLGVLLYTLVYGAMPFDGSNFKRLVKQITQGDFYEPPTPSSASPLIRSMLAVSAEKRANIAEICSHWWVNDGEERSCLDEAEELANQTPVRLDLLLSLAPKHISSEHMVIQPDEEDNSQRSEDGQSSSSAAPNIQLPPPPPVPPPPNGGQSRSLSMGAIDKNGAAAAAAPDILQGGTPSGTTSKDEEKGAIRKRKEASVEKTASGEKGEKKKLKKKSSQDEDKPKKKTSVKKKESSPMDVDEQPVKKKSVKKSSDASIAGSSESVSETSAKTEKKKSTTKKKIKDSEKKKTTDVPKSNDASRESTPKPSVTTSDRAGEVHRPKNVKSPSNKSVLSAVSADGTLKASDSSISTRQSASPAKSVIEVETKSVKESKPPSCKASEDSEKVSKVASIGKVPKTSVSRNSSTVNSVKSSETMDSIKSPASTDEVLKETVSKINLEKSPEHKDVKKKPPSSENSKESSKHSSVVSTPARSRTGSESSSENKGSRRGSKIFSKAAMWDNMCQQNDSKPPPAGDKGRPRGAKINMSDLTKKFEEKPPPDRKKPVVGAVKISDVKKSFENKSSEKISPAYRRPSKDTSGESIASKRGGSSTPVSPTRGDKREDSLPPPARPGKKPSEETVAKGRDSVVSKKEASPEKTKVLSKEKEKSPTKSTRNRTSPTKESQPIPRPGTKRDVTTPKRTSPVKEKSQPVSIAIKKVSSVSKPDDADTKTSVAKIKAGERKERKSSKNETSDSSDSESEAEVLLRQLSERREKVEAAKQEKLRKVSQQKEEESKSKGRINRPCMNQDSKKDGLPPLETPSDTPPDDIPIKPISIPKASMKDAEQPDSKCATLPKGFKNKTDKSEGLRQRKKSEVEITLSQGKLNREDTKRASYAEIQLAPQEYKAEVRHSITPSSSRARHIPSSSSLSVESPASTPPTDTSLLQRAPRERIIPIMMEKTEEDPEEDRRTTSSTGSSSTRSLGGMEASPSPFLHTPLFKGGKTAAVGPLGGVFGAPGGGLSVRGSRGSLLSNMNASTASPEPIRKSRRERIIPISFEGDDTSSNVSSGTSSLDSARHPPTTSTPYHTKGRRNPDSILGDYRPDSMSSADDSQDDDEGDEEDEDGFHSLTAESLFSTLLNRVRNLTKNRRMPPLHHQMMGPMSSGFSPFSGTGLHGIHSPSLRQQDPFADHGRFWSSLYSPPRELSRQASETSAHGDNRSNSSLRGGTGTPSWGPALSRDLSQDSTMSAGAQGIFSSQSGSFDQSAPFNTLPRAPSSRVIEISQEPDEEETPEGADSRRSSMGQNNFPGRRYLVSHDKFFGDGGY